MSTIAKLYKKQPAKIIQLVGKATLLQQFITLQMMKKIQTNTFLQQQTISNQTKSNSNLHDENKSSEKNTTEVNRPVNRPPKKKNEGKTSNNNSRANNGQPTEHGEQLTQRTKGRTQKR